jgi:hypothetical protein
MRDINYMCEAVTRDSKSWWTIDGGYCLPYPIAYQTLSLDITASINKCRFALKCVLSNGLDQTCNCTSVTACHVVLNKACAGSTLVYPASGPLLFPYVRMGYARERDWTNKKPDILEYSGRVKCVGYHLVTKDAWWWWPDEKFQYYDYRFSEYLLCNLIENVTANRNYSGPRYDADCWDNSKTFNNRSYQVSFRCETRCISKYRVRDGIRDCYLDEELKSINNSCPQIQRHRLQCSSSELTCLLAGALGNWGSACLNGRDEFDYKSGRVLTRDINCEKKTDSGCAYVRNYIRISSHDDTNELTFANSTIFDDHSTIAIPFRSYCDSFFDTRSGIDESSQFCKKWACFSSEYQCLSGQCIPHSWVCDGKLTLLVVSILAVIFLLVFCR